MEFPIGKKENNITISEPILIKENENTFLLKETDAELKTTINNTNNIIKVNIALPYLQEIIDKVGLINFHFHIVFASCLFFFNDGCKIFELNFIYPELKKILNLSDFSRGVLTASLFFGKILGSITSGLISSHFGRETPLKILAVCLSLFSLIVILFENFGWLVFCRIIVGYTLESMNCLFLSTLVELIPTRSRELILITVMIFQRVGIIFYTVFFYVILGDNIEETDNLTNPTLIWKYSIALSSIVTVFGCIITWTSVKETPRFLICNKRVAEGIKVLKEITPREILINERKILEESEDYYKNTTEGSFKDLFSKYFKITLFCCLIIYCACTNNIGNMYALPKSFKNQFNSKLLISIIFQQGIAIIAGLALGAVFINIKALGRKYSLFISFICPAIIALITIIDNTGFEFYSPIMNIFILTGYIFIKIYIGEIFPTRLRVNAYALTIAVAQIANLLTPLLCDLLTINYKYGSVVLLLISSIIGSIVCLFIPVETSGKEIDSF